MVALWVIVGLIIATISVSVLGAAFSVVGIGALFSGALLAVYAMASALEFAKFVLAAYLHQRWHKMNVVFKYYLVAAVFILSAITSMGIFGFLSDAYQSASTAIEVEDVKIANLRTQKASQQAEIDRLNRSIDEIPENRISKRMKARTEAEPAIATMTQKIDAIDGQLGQSNLNLIEVKRKVGPLIYISKAFKLEIDTVVKYLILLLVSVFDPLAICLVIATSEALESRKSVKYQRRDSESPEPEVANDEFTQAAESEESEAGIIQMRFADDKDKKRKTV